MIRELESLIREEFKVEVEGGDDWDCAFKNPSLLEAHFLGELEEIEEDYRKPIYLSFKSSEVLKKGKGEDLKYLRGEVSFLLKTKLNYYFLIQRELFKLGYPPTSGLLLLALLERLRLRAPLELPEGEYPHQNLKGDFKDYLKEGKLENLLDLLPKFMELLDKSKRLALLKLLWEESRRERVRIMTDVLKRLPPELQSKVKNLSSPELAREELTGEILREVKALPSWMRDYLEQSIYLRIVESDLKILPVLLPKFLKYEVEHKGFVKFIFKGLGKLKSKSFRPDGNFSLEGNEALRQILLKKIRSLLPWEEEGQGGHYRRGKRINHYRFAYEFSIKRGMVFKRREVKEEKPMGFKIVFDSSSSIGKGEKAKLCLSSLHLLCSVLEEVGLPYSVDTFNEEVFKVKDFLEPLDQRELIQKASSFKGATNLSKAIDFALKDCLSFNKRTKLKSIILVISDGEPTRGLRGEDLRAFLRRVKNLVPTFGIGIGRMREKVYYYFGENCVGVEDLNSLPFVLTSVIERKLKTLWR